MFELHKQLKKDTFEVIDLKLSKVLLMNDVNYPWLILVPKLNNISEINDLSVSDQQQLMQEISAVSNVLKELTAADKMNIASLGNMVPQLHIHVIARFKNDLSWPAPIWGKSKALAYGENIKNEFLSALRDKLA